MKAEARRASARTLLPLLLALLGTPVAAVAADGGEAAVPPSSGPSLPEAAEGPAAGGPAESDPATGGTATGETAARRFAPADGRPTFLVATKEAAPFATRGPDGRWSGLSISLWETLADELDLAFRFEEASLADMIEGVADGRYDASVAAMTITPARERRIDFSHPFYSTGFGIVVPQSRRSVWQMAGSVLSPAFFKAVGALALLLSLVGLCFWLAERRRNGEEFRPGLRGLGDGFWFSAVTMTTTGYGDMAPRTLVGRLVGLVWMFAALLITSTFTGMIASSLTAERLSLAIEGPADLPDVSVGSITGSAAEEWLAGRGIAFLPRDGVAAGLAALETGELQAFVYDRPLLRYLVARSHADTLELVPGTFGRQDYGIVLPPGSALREPLNRALLRYLTSDEWEALQLRWLGPRV